MGIFVRYFFSDCWFWRRETQIVLWGDLTVGHRADAEEPSSQGPFQGSHFRPICHRRHVEAHERGREPRAYPREPSSLSLAAAVQRRRAVLCGSEVTVTCLTCCRRVSLCEFEFVSYTYAGRQHQLKVGKPNQIPMTIPPWFPRQDGHSIYIYTYIQCVGRLSLFRSVFNFNLQKHARFVYSLASPHSLFLQPFPSQPSPLNPSRYPNHPSLSLAKLKFLFLSMLTVFSFSSYERKTGCREEERGGCAPPTANIQWQPATTF